MLMGCVLDKELTSLTESQVWGVKPKKAKWVRTRMIRFKQIMFFIGCQSVTFVWDL